MAIFPISGVLRWLMPSMYCKYASGLNPCAVLLIEKIPHFLTKKNVKRNESNEFEIVTHFSGRQLDWIDRK
jgi:hypothetical protein